MICLTVLYPKTADSMFDLDYYSRKHVPLVQERLTPLGLTKFDYETGLAGGTPDALPAFAAIGRLHFATLEDLQTGLGMHGPELVADIAHFTNVQPIMQVSQLS